jgi:hypothetical protein
MYISHETLDQTNARLAQVLIDAAFMVHTGEYAFVEVPLSQFPQALNPSALAFVRDDEVW